jgi:hypothetical protein
VDHVDVPKLRLIMDDLLQWGHASSAWITARSPTLCEVGH